QDKSASAVWMRLLRYGAEPPKVSPLEMAIKWNQGIRAILTFKLSQDNLIWFSYRFSNRDSNINDYINTCLDSYCNLCFL
ncbi:MAG: hypothetical protein ACKPKO_05630, partial [Candidatus Fonsibacter sp.]